MYRRKYGYAWYRHIITTKIEHHAILRTCGYLEQNGYEITYLPVNDKGTVSLEQVRQAIRPDTILISVMMANNEIGTIEPIARIGMLARRYGICFHTDAVQAYGHIPIEVNRMNIDMMSASAHKFNGPKGNRIFYMCERKRGYLLLSMEEARKAVSGRELRMCREL